MIAGRQPLVADKTKQVIISQILSDRGGGQFTGCIHQGEGELAHRGDALLGNGVVAGDFAYRIPVGINPVRILAFIGENIQHFTSHRVLSHSRCRYGVEITCIGKQSGKGGGVEDRSYFDGKRCLFQCCRANKRRDERPEVGYHHTLFHLLDLHQPIELVVLHIVGIEGGA